MTSSRCEISTIAAKESRRTSSVVLEQAILKQLTHNPSQRVTQNSTDAHYNRRYPSCRVERDTELEDTANRGRQDDKHWLAKLAHDAIMAADQLSSEIFQPSESRKDSRRRLQGMRSNLT